MTEAGPVVSGKVHVNYSFPCMLKGMSNVQSGSCMNFRDNRSGVAFSGFHDTFTGADAPGFLVTALAIASGFVSIAKRD